MSDERPQISVLDARLAEIDQRLRTIQTGLVMEPPAPTATGAAPELPPRVEVPEPGSSAAGLSATPVPAADQSYADVVAQLRELAVAHEHLLGSMRDLVSDYERARTGALTESRSTPAAAGAGAPAGIPAGTAARDPAGAPEGAAPEGAAPGGEASLTVTAGPFAGTEAVRGFERALATLPGVSGVELRGYEGGDRAIVDVHLSATTS